MKMFLMSIMMLLSLTAHAIIQTTGGAALDATGAIKIREEAFIKVKNGSGGSLANGAVVVYDVAADDGITVVAGSALGQYPACVMAQACAANALCKCQVYGYHSAALVDLGAANANAKTPAYVSQNGSGYVTGMGSAAATHIPVGYFLDSAAATGTVELFINIK